jgi:hypothetical protein
MNEPGWESTRPLRSAALVGVLCLAVVSPLLILGAFGILDGLPHTRLGFWECGVLTAGVATGLSGLWLLGKTLTRIRWNDEWVEVAAPFARTRMRWGSVRDYSTKGFRTVGLVADRPLALMWRYTANPEVFDAVIHEKLRELREAKVRAALERGFLSIAGRRLVWRGAVIEELGKPASAHLRLDELVLVDSLPVSAFATQGMVHHLEDKEGRSCELRDSWPGTAVMLEILKRRAPKGVVWLSPGTKLDATNEAFTLRKRIKRNSREGKRVLLGWAGLGAYFICEPVWTNAKREIERGEHWWIGARHGLWQVRSELLNTGLVFALFAAIIVVRHLRMQARLRALEAAEGAAQGHQS